METCTNPEKLAETTGHPKESAETQWNCVRYVETNGNLHNPKGICRNHRKPSGICRNTINFIVLFTNYLELAVTKRNVEKPNKTNIIQMKPKGISRNPQEFVNTHGYWPYVYEIQWDLYKTKETCRTRMKEFVFVCNQCEFAQTQRNVQKQNIIGGSHMSSS